MTSGRCWLLTTLLLTAATADSTDFFLRELFQKYGNRGVITYEGFEHLLENLGLGRLEFDKSHSVAIHRVNGTFHDVHDQLRLHTHDHSRGRRDADSDAPLELDLGIPPPDEEADGPESPPEALITAEESRVPPVRAGSCLSAQELLRSHGLPTNHGVLISQPVFLHLCPAIVYEIDQRACLSGAGHIHVITGGTPPGAAWIYATLSITVISISGLLGMAVVPFTNKACYQQLLSFLVAMAIGTLCGDALLHMLPHALSSADHVVQTFRSLAVFGAILFFYCTENILRLRDSSDCKKNIVDKDLDVQQKIINSGENGTNLELGAMLEEVEGKVPVRHSHSQSRSHNHGHRHSHSGAASISSVAWMVIAGDGLHNLTDGLAIGAAFAGGSGTGLATALAVFFHELPHELGDFAVLLQSGMSIRRALMYNILSSILSFLGMACGVWVGKYEEAATWIYSGTAGTFLYIALVDLVPEMSSVNGGPLPIKDLIIRVSGIVVGGTLMLLIALYEESLGTLFN